MSHNLEYYDKYLKYKFKYLKLKELLGGMDPRTFNVKKLNDNPNHDQLYLMISNLLTDMIIYNVLKKYNLESTFITLQPLEKQQIEKCINSAFLCIELLRIIKHKGTNLRETINKIIKSTMESDQIQKKYAPPDSSKNQTEYMYMFGMKLEYLDNTSNKFDTNVHISCQKTGKSTLYYHLSVSNRKSANGQPVSVHFTDELAIFNELKKHRMHYNKRYFQNIILGIAAINFGDSSFTGRNELSDLLKLPNPVVSLFLIELLDYINTYLYTKLINDIDLDDVIKDEVMTTLTPMATPPMATIATPPMATPSIATTVTTPSSGDEWETQTIIPAGKEELMAEKEAEEIKAKQAKQDEQELKIATRIQNKKQALLLPDFLRYLQAKTTKIETLRSRL
jgi:hypothetical protein